MGILGTLAISILGISLFIFIALFGRLPTFRKTPIGLLHRIICIHIPNGLISVDSYLLGGRLLFCWNRSGNYILHENHPLVLIFFSSLLIAGEWMFIPSAWSRISTIHRLCIPVLVLLPYVFLYASVVTKSYITPENHADEMVRYPYDRVNFHPGHRCRTCNFLKPARSKHCSFCKACVSRHDHHCVWLTNCVGLNNYRYFLSLLLSLSVLLIYGSCLGYSLVSQSLEKLIPSSSHLRSGNQSWTTFFNVWAIAITSDIRVGAVSLLTAMTAPLAVAFLVYHAYLIWAGTTTNESAKWSDWKEDVADGVVFKSTRGEIYGTSSEPTRDQISWPVSSDQILIIKEGQPPSDGFMFCSLSNAILQKDDPQALVDTRWRQVSSMREIDNIYDLGFGDNLRDAFNLPIRR
ncbi:DHHC palmitoyltransferase family protein [Aspergillus clavatus NRRL 1]|uniref:Palmitoyltransferase n=1 Tax=Aspergillus clavatus (strain ATCC 1007 / CBS 513.65 / DSM 816 / NCTC 3887 / NRRL 1 / QM 1276 / 107) TaxID=344612 RepID=A1CT46_ASPCL|nr:DHHC zinc finger domain protein [Aspergillus clavatus NRRL 1]EAW06483.1 DHHC zinc finger domain protein [Aspergillus clavatus NRRL 1]